MAGGPAEFPPRLPVSVGAVITDGAGRLLVLEPTYKSGWTIPGGQMEADGETPWEACRREVREECGLVVERGRLRCVDFLRPRPGHAGGLRLLFDCGRVDDDAVAGIVLQAGEIADFRFVELPEADKLLSGPLRRRVTAAMASSSVVYLEDGRPVPSVPA
jgi:8-oxo-dGTP diphosphatase